MKRRTKRKLKNFILMTIIALLGATFFLSITMLQSDSYIPYVAFAVSGVGLTLIGIANR